MVILMVICSMVYTVLSIVFGIFVMLVSATKASDKLNSHLPSGPINPYQLDESISNLRSVWCTFSFFFHFE